MLIAHEGNNNFGEISRYCSLLSRLVGSYFLQRISRSEKIYELTASPRYLLWNQTPFAHSTLDTISGLAARARTEILRENGLPISWNTTFIQTRVSWFSRVIRALGNLDKWSVYVQAIKRSVKNSVLMWISWIVIKSDFLNCSNKNRSKIF